MRDSKKAQINFLGGFRLLDRTGVERTLPIVKGVALIAYLTASATGRATRGDLTGLLWGDKPDATARTALRQCLHQLRSRLAEVEPPFLHISSDAVAIDRACLETDIDNLLRPAKEGEAAFHYDVDPRDFLLGFEDLDPAFSDWLWSLREELSVRFLAALKTTIINAAAPLEQRKRAAERLNALDPSQEIAARFLIERAARERDLTTLMRLYRALWDAMDEELGEEPSGELQDFVGRFRAKFGEPPAEDNGAPTNGPRRKYLAVLALEAGWRDASDGRATLKRAEEAIVARGGAIASKTDGALSAVFGLRLAEENCARDGIEVALELREILGADAPFGIGMDAGYVAASGGGANGGIDISAEVFDVAGTLAQAAKGGSVQATARSMRSLEALYDIDAADPAKIGARIGAKSVLRVSGRRNADALLMRRGKRETFVGRTPFLAALAEIWVEATETSTLQIACIQGQPGVGKTRLAGEFIRRLQADGVRTLRAICSTNRGDAPLEPIRQLARDAARGDLETEPGEETEAETPAAAAAATSAAELSVDAIVADLQATIQRSPTVIFIDDWHWSEAATRRALAKFTSAPTGSSLLIILTLRGASADDWLAANAHEIILTNMTAREVMERAELLLDRSIDGRMRDWILAKSGGNPLFLEEICHAIAEAQVENTSDALTIELPASIQSLFASRLERLSQAELDIVFAAAVSGDDFDAEVISDVIGRQVSVFELEQLCENDIFTRSGANGALRFKHGLARDVAYETVPPNRRREMHFAFAEMLLQEPEEEADVGNAERLAFHFRGGGDPARAGRFAELSGDKALRASALDQAIWHYNAALELVEQLTETEETLHRRVSLTLRWAIPSTYAPSYEQLPVLKRAEGIARKVGDKRSTAALRYWRAFFLYVLGEKTSALNALESAGEMAAALGDERQGAEVAAIKGCALGSIARYAEAEAKMREAITIKDRNPSTSGRSPVVSVYTRANLAFVIADQGDFDGAAALISEALHRVRDFEHEVESSILLFAGTIDIWRGDWEAALATGLRARARSEKVSSPYLTGMSRCIWGYAHWRLHGGEQGLAILSRNARWMRERGMGLYFSCVSGWLAEAMAESGDSEAAEAAYRDALKRAEEGEIAGAAMACRASALVAAKSGRRDLVQERLEEAAVYADRRSAAHEIAANHIATARFLQPADARARIERAATIYAELGLEHRSRMLADDESEIAMRS